MPRVSTPGEHPSGPSPRLPRSRPPQGKQNLYLRNQGKKPPRTCEVGLLTAHVTKGSGLAPSLRPPRAQREPSPALPAFARSRSGTAWLSPRGHRPRARQEGPSALGLPFSRIRIQKTLPASLMAREKEPEGDGPGHGEPRAGASGSRARALALGGRPRALRVSSGSQVRALTARVSSE